MTLFLITGGGVTAIRGLGYAAKDPSPHGPPALLVKKRGGSECYTTGLVLFICIMSQHSGTTHENRACLLHWELGEA